MIVCICHAVSDRTIRAAIDQGAKSVDAVGRACEAGTGCGGCRSMLQNMIDGCAPLSPQRAAKPALVMLRRPRIATA